ncbi:iron ABC transporter permease [Paenibacillus sp. PAMC21692]|uniref:ABC transporter permease n=1 Tax=Paenibacillus sp. PAMC21692 TaxID=2762320 RepID=UPI00164D6BB7|nr:iron ABC transporter permease [Paenibacillus sp. PAMC21692]QNK59733.1 iron ABC transporter permease [Paenibacillus sp. PAMC21692]
MYSSLLQRFRQRWNGWIAISGIGAFAALLPSLYILAGLWGEPGENWTHIRTYILPSHLMESLQLVVGTVAASVAIGVSLAWLVAAYDFPLRRMFSALLVLPLAIPPYIAAYTYGDMLSYTGTVQKLLRNGLGVTPNQRYFDIMSMQGAVFIFAMFLFPYVYLMTKSFLERHSAAYIDNARLLGHRPLSVFLRVVLPLSQGAIVGGASLVAFEVLGDYGVAKHFGIQTFTVAIFKTWFGMYDLQSAIRLAGALMGVLIGIFVIERLLRSRKRFNASVSGGAVLKRKRLRRIPAALTVGFCSIVVLLSFIIPVAQLTVWATWTYDDIWNDKFPAMIRNTVSVSAAAVCIIMLMSVIAANSLRMWRSGFTLAGSKLLLMGYSIPGAVMAIGVLALFLSLDQALSGLYGMMGLGEGKLVLSMSLAMLVFAFVARFLSVGFNAVDAGYDRIGTKYAEASRLLGYGATSTFFRIDWPLLKGSILTGAIMTFMEVVKELPLTLLLRPFNFDTLATKAYQYASDEQIHQASLPSLLIITLGVASVCLYHFIGRGEKA